MKAVKLLLGLNLCVLLTGANAQSADRSSFEKIQDLYESSTMPASLEDFEKYGTQTKVKCLMMWPNGYSEEVAPLQKRTLVIKNAQPANGPLLPPTSQITKREVLVPADVIDFSGGYSDKLSYELDQFSTLVSLRNRSSYLQVNILPGLSNSSSKNWFYNLGTPVEINIRKNADYVAMKMAVIPTDVVQNVIAYQYCWKK